MKGSSKGKPHDSMVFRNQENEESSREKAIGADGIPPKVIGSEAPVII